MWKRDDHVDALRIPPVEQQQILNELETADRVAPEAVLRKTPRYRYAVQEGIAIEPEGLTASFVVCPRNISAGGISFLHGSFLYPRSACRLTLRTVDGEYVIAAGCVVRCRCVRGRVHEVGVQFAEPIDVEDFVVAKEGAPPPASATTVSGCEVTEYPAAAVVDIARQLQELARDGAPREQVLRKLAQLATLLHPAS